MERVFPTLGESESSTLPAAVNQEQPCLVIIDETAGRAIASELGLAVTDVAGVINHCVLADFRPKASK